MFQWWQRLLFGTDTSLSWECVGHAAPEEEVTLELHGLATPLDVSRNCVPVGLCPCLIGIALANAEFPARAEQLAWSLIVRTQQFSRAVLGRVHLCLTRRLPFPSHTILLFRPTGSTHRCLSTLRRSIFQAYTHWTLFWDRNPENLKMNPAEMLAFYVLSMSPRPVVLVSYTSGSGGNIFPMDLVGSTTSAYSLLGLHTTSPAIPAMTASRRLAISTIPLDCTDTIFGMGHNHRQATIDWTRVPLALKPSPTYSIPVPESALSVREVEVERVEDLASHQLFVARNVSFEQRTNGLQMCHVPWFYQRYLARTGQALPASPHPI